MSVKTLKKAIKLSYARFKPNEYQRRYHFAIAFEGNRPILVTKNNPIKVNAKAYRMGQKFNIQQYKEYPFVHAESHLVSKLLDRYNTIRSDWTLVVLRINRQGRLLLSKPCINCEKILNAVDLKKVYWSIDNNTFGAYDGNLIDLRLKETI